MLLLQLPEGPGCGDAAAAAGGAQRTHFTQSQQQWHMHSVMHASHNSQLTRPSCRPLEKHMVTDCPAHTHTHPQPASMCVLVTHCR